MSQYDAEVDLTNVNNSQTAIVSLVGPDRRVLDVGCWKGHLGRALRAQGCHVSGVDISADAIAVAAEVLDDARVADLDSTPLTEVFPGETFDVIVLADVLEHLRYPERLLREATGMLREGGSVVMSIPNVTHGSVRLALLQGRWSYTEAGLLDRTHIRFFSRSSLLAMLRDTGYVVDDLRSIVVDVLSREVRYAEDDIPPTIIEWVRDQPDAMTFQFIVRAHPGDPADAVTPELVPVVPERSLRPHDRYTEQVSEGEQARHHLLTLRDHVLGLEAAAASARQRAEQAESRAQRLRQRLTTKNKTLVQVRARVRRLEQRLEHPAGPAPISVRQLGRRVQGRLDPRRGR